MSSMIGEGELPKKEESQKKNPIILYMYRKELAYAFAELEGNPETKYRYVQRF